MKHHYLEKCSRSKQQLSEAFGIYLTGKTNTLVVANALHKFVAAVLAERSNTSEYEWHCLFILLQCCFVTVDESLLVLLQIIATT